MPVPPPKPGDDERPPSDDDRIAELEEHVRGSLQSAAGVMALLENRIEALEARVAIVEASALAAVQSALSDEDRQRLAVQAVRDAFGAGPDLEGEPGPDDDLSDQRVAELCELDNTWGTGNLAREVKRRREAARLRNDRTGPVLTEIKRAIQELRWGKPGDAERILVKLETTLSPKGLRGASGRREGKKGHERFLSRADEG